MKGIIYKITSIVNNYFYIGSTNNFNKRKNNHLWYLKKNKHCNKHMQNIFNKYTITNLKFEILEECSLEDRYIIEQKYINDLKPIFNIRKTVTCIDPKCYTIDALERMSNFQKYFKNKPENKEKASNILKERWKNNKEYFEKMRALNSENNHPQRKINTEIAKQILNDIMSCSYKRKEICKKYNISIHIYKDIQRGKTWKSIQLK